MKEYGILYAKVVFPSNHRLYWLNHCFLTNILPKDLQEEIKKLSTDINSKYKDSIIVPMDNSIIPGCVSKPESIEGIANDIYQGMLDIFKRLTGDENCIRLVYGIGEVNEDHMENHVKSAHQVGSFPIMIKIGHFLDYGPGGKKSKKSDHTPGMFKV
jgi:hypothetical protein